MGLGHETALSEMKQLNSMGVSLVIQELLEAEKLDFPTVARHYVQHLETENHRLYGDISTLSLYLGLLLVDMPPGTKHMREFMFKRGYHKGSQYGDRLEKEFSQEAKQGPHAD